MDGHKLRRLEWLILLWASASVVTGFVVSLVSPEYFHDVFAAEDHYIENMTVVSLLGAFLICADRIYRIGRSRGAIFLAVGLLSALLFAFGAGEELSWGQRLLHIPTPDFFIHHNAQKELNLHNLVFGGTKVNKVVFSDLLGVFVVLYLVVFPYAYPRVGGLKRIADEWGVPVPRLYQVILYAVSTVLVLLIPDSRRWEVLEFAGASTFWLIFWYPTNRDACMLSSWSARESRRK